MRNKSLKTARKRKDDEWYTKLSTVETELQHYDLRGKIIYMPCDDAHSAFWVYLHTHFSELELRAIVATHYNMNNDPGIYYTGGNDADTSVFEVFPLRTNGYMCADNDELWSIAEQCDIIITNPPFSKIRELYPLWLEQHIDMIVMGTVNTLTYVCLRKYFIANTLHVGYTVSKTEKFDRPDGTEKEVPCITWYTTLPVQKTYEDILTKKYNPENYERFKYIDAINVDKSKDIPYDYAGLMAVPMSFIKWLDPERFELIDTVNGHRKMELTSGRSTYARLIIRNRMLQ